MGSEYPEALDYFIDPRRVFVGQNSHSAIVLHGTGGNPEQRVEDLGNWFRAASNTGNVSAHFGIGRDGRIAQYVHLDDGAAANCCLEPGHDPFWDQFGGDNLNVHTISIEHINDVSNSLPLTSAQKEASFKLIAYLCDKYNLTADQVKTHKSIAPGSRERCPGAAFPLNELKAFLQGGPMQPYGPGKGDFDHWFVANDNDHWTCIQTNHVVMFGNLALFKQLSVDGNTLPFIGLPRTGELYQNEPDGYAWSVQFFERGLIVYDKEHRRDGQPGMTDCYLGKYEQFRQYDPSYKLEVVEVSTTPRDIEQLGEALSTAFEVMKGRGWTG